MKKGCGVWGVGCREVLNFECVNFECVNFECVNCFAPSAPSAPSALFSPSAPDRSLSSRSLPIAPSVLLSALSFFSPFFGFA
ncbi:hypothetical protein [Scytonema millei]|uniref:Uncharacterized protein n=1 Tax=Scytonema millei VB511283 TaxID=1245923 RepID=A0A9X5E9X4_9CYAN|nr:hypothetical protein [Scytonema millei]NHC37927.1 hypothetical protein [Scytonema millei VB511283]